MTTTTRSYLRELGVALYGGFSRAERADILADYAGFFEQGKRDGLTEEAVREELGKPSAVAISLAAESGKRPPYGALVLENLCRVRLISGALIFFAAALFYHYLPGRFAAPSAVAFMALMCFALLLAFGGPSPRFGRGLLPLICANGILLCLALFCCLFFNSGISRDFAMWAFENRPAFLSNGLAEIRNACLAAAGLVGLWSVAGLLRGRSERLVPAVHAAGFFIYLEALVKLWRALDAADEYWESVSQTILVYAAAVLFTAACAVFLAIRERGVRKNA